MELWRLKVHVRRNILCTAHAQRAFFIFNWLYLVTDVSFGDRKGVTFLSFASSFMWCEQFCPRRTFHSDDFTLQGNLRQKSSNPPAATSILPAFVGILSKCVLYHSRYQHTKFCTCMKNPGTCNGNIALEKQV